MRPRPLTWLNYARTGRTERPSRVLLVGAVSRDVLRLCESHVGQGT